MQNKAAISLTFLLGFFVTPSFSEQVMVGVINESKKDIRFASLMIQLRNEKAARPLYIGSLPCKSRPVWVAFECPRQATLVLTGLVDGISVKHYSSVDLSSSKNNHQNTPVSITPGCFLVSRDDLGQLKASKVSDLKGHAPLKIAHGVWNVCLSELILFSPITPISSIENEIKNTKLLQRMFEPPEVPSEHASSPETANSYVIGYQNGWFGTLLGPLSDRIGLRMHNFMFIEPLNISPPEKANCVSSLSSGFFAGQDRAWEILRD